MKESFSIGSFRLSNPFLLAPLAGFTDKSMRTLCEEQGAALTYTEMVSGKGLKYGDRKTRKLLELTEYEKGRTGYQLFGNDPEILAFGAETLSAYDNAVLDLNCGCPVPKIVKNGEGSALLKNIDLLYDCIKAMVSAGGGKPVTAKIRMGFNLDEDVAVEAAKAVEAAGGAAVTVHGRTRQQFYEGKANWDVIARVKRAVAIPVIGNGDIRSGELAIRMLEETGCDGVMIARGAMGNPWIFRDALALWNSGWSSSDREGAEDVLRGLGISGPTEKERIEMAIRHLDMVCQDKGEDIAVREMRKFIGFYTKSIHGAAPVRREANSVRSRDAMVHILSNLLNNK